MTEHSAAATLSDIDDIAIVAVDEFCRSTRPLREDILMLVDLVMPLLPRLRGDSRSKIASALAASAFAPKALLLALCDFPVAVCSPILTRSSALNSAELLAIISQHGEDHARAIARRKGLKRQVVDALREMNSAGVDRALDLRQRIENAETGETGAPGDDPFDAYRSRMHGELGNHAKLLSEEELDALTALAGDANGNLLHTAVADAVGITVTSAAALCADPTSKNLLYALRFMGAQADKAFDVFRALAPVTASRDGVRGRFMSVYASVTIELAVRKVWSWRSDDLLAIAGQAFAANDSEALETLEDMPNVFGDIEARVA